MRALNTSCNMERGNRERLPRELNRRCAVREYKLISADGHIIEPPDLWTERLPEKFKSRAPHQVSLEQGDAWILEGARDPINFGAVTSGGRPVEEVTPWRRWDEVRKSGYDPAARLVDQDTDGVDAEVLYPSPRPSASLFNNPDPEFQVALIRAYNDWLSEYCSHAPDRLIGAAMMPTVSVDAAIDEMHRTMEMPGLGSALLGKYPSAGPTVMPEDDKFWAAAQEMGIPISIHVGLSSGAPGDMSRSTQGGGELRMLDAPVRTFQLIYAGIFDRFPNLKVVFAETDCAWIPCVKEQMDNRVRRANPERRPKIAMKPSEYFDDHLYYTYITDTQAVIFRHHVGIKSMMWSSDFPHTGTDWPNSWKVIEEDYAGVAENEKHAILAGNAVGVYKLGNGA